MDVRNIREPAKELGSEQSKRAQSLKRSADSLKLKRQEVKDAVELESSGRREFVISPQVRARTNEAISVVNLAEEATSEIEKLVTSLAGIVEQADSDKVPEQRRKVLEKEANQLVREIKVKAQVKTADGSQPLSGEPVSIKVDENFAKTLEIILPDNAKDAFKIGEIKFSPKQAIVQTRDMIAKARQQLEELKHAVSNSKDSIKETVDSLEVALQNTEAASATLRDVDKALKLASDTKFGIARDPQGALNSVGDFKKTALQLLE